MLDDSAGYPPKSLLPLFKGELIRDDIEARLLEFPSIERVEIEEVFERWSLEDVSPRGLEQLRQVGVT